jgi:hypothetical protein
MAVIDKDEFTPGNPGTIDNIKILVSKNLLFTTNNK